MYLDNFIWCSSTVQHYIIFDVCSGILFDMYCEIPIWHFIWYYVHMYYRNIYTSDSESLAYIFYRQMTKPSFFSRFRKRANLESRLFSSFRKLNAGNCSVHLFWNYIKCSVYMRNWGSHRVTLFFHMLRLAGDRYFKVSHFSKEV